MIGTRFEYAAPSTTVEAAELLAPDPDGARVLGGGTWVVPELSRGDSDPRLLVDLRRAGIDGVEEVDGGIRIGAMCSYVTLLEHPLVAEHAPLLRHMAGGVTGGRALREQGTVGGSVAAARPSSEVPAALGCLRAVAVVRGPGGVRRLPVADVPRAAMVHALARDELIEAFEVPSHAGLRHGYLKLKRGASSWPIATAAVVLAGDADGVREVRLTMGGVAERPLEVDLDDLLLGRRPGREELEAAGDRAAALLEEPWDDALAPARYRAAVAAPVARRALAMALGVEPAPRGAGGAFH